MAQIASITGHVIRDSRGDDNVSCTMTLDDGTSVMASVPRGKSVGSREAYTAPAADAASALSGEIARLLAGADPADQRGIDEMLIRAAGGHKKDLGANATLAASIVTARAAAVSSREPLWKHIRRLWGEDGVSAPLPRPLVNIVNGGAHAEGSELLQEHLLIPRDTDLSAALARAEDAYERVGAFIRARLPDVPLGDEGGFAPPLLDSATVFEWIREALGPDTDLFEYGIDAAAGERHRAASDVRKEYEEIMARCPLAYIEDPFGDDAFDDFASFAAAYPAVTIVGDDLTVTDASRIREAAARKSISGVIIKPNQAGTVSEALLAAHAAREAGLRVFASHRSGETDDTFIADLAVGIAADGIKIGAPVQPERRVKYERLRAIAAEVSL